MHKLFNPEYRLRRGWGHTVRILDPLYETHLGETVDPEEEEEIIQWCMLHSGGKRIGFDEWQFPTAEAAKEFIVMFTLRWS